MDVLNEILTQIKDRNSLLAIKENYTGTFYILFVSYNHFLMLTFSYIFYSYFQC